MAMYNRRELAKVTLAGLAAPLLGTFARAPRTRRRLALVTGAISIAIGILWGVPMAALLLA